MVFQWDIQCLCNGIEFKTIQVRQQNSGKSHCIYDRKLSLYPLILAVFLNKTHIKFRIVGNHDRTLAELHKFRQNLLNLRCVNDHIILNWGQFLDSEWNWHFRVYKCRKAVCNDTTDYFHCTDLNNLILIGAETGRLQIKHHIGLIEALSLRICDNILQVVHQIRFHTVDNLKIVIRTQCMVCIRECLYIAVVGDRNRLMSPFHGTLYDVFTLGHTIHITHLCMTVQFHTLLRTGVHTGGRKVCNLLNSNDRTDC